MIKAEDIYKVTNNGLDIILHYYPQARDCVGPSFRMETDAPRPASLPIPHLYFIQNFSNLVTFVCLKEKSLKIK